MIYQVKENEIVPQNYLTMEPMDFVKFISTHKLAVFQDDDMIFTQYHGIQIVRKFSQKVI